MRFYECLNGKSDIQQLVLSDPSNIGLPQSSLNYFSQMLADLKVLCWKQVRYIPASLSGFDRSIDNLKGTEEYGEVKNDDNDSE